MERWPARPYSSMGAGSGQCCVIALQLLPVPASPLMQLTWFSISTIVDNHFLTENLFFLPCVLPFVGTVQKGASTRNKEIRKERITFDLKVPQSKFWCPGCAPAAEKFVVCLSVFLSVCWTHAWIATKQEKVMPRFLYTMKEHLSQFFQKKNAWGRPVLPELFDQTDTVGAKMPIFNRYLLLEPQP